ncbi:MAG: M1 family metallopeptidase [Anaerolineales bacterium]|nr:M1 family metallopeptidase [Anaerolineales bacterium]
MKKLFLLALIFLTACESLPTYTPEPDYPVVKTNPTIYDAKTSDPVGLGDPFYPMLGNPGYDVNHYDIALTVDPTSNTISGMTTIEAVALEDLSQFNLDMSGLEVDSVSVDGVDADFSRSQMELTISPRSPITAKQAFTVAVTYHGSPEPVMDDSIHMPLGWQKMTGGLFVFSEPSGAMNWFPCNNHWSDKATYAFRISVPDDFEVVANGRRENISASEVPGYSTQVWVMDDPMSTYLATIVIGQYESESQQSTAGVDIHNFYPLGTPDNVKDDFARTPEMIDFFGVLIAPYPFDNYGAVLANEELGFAFEAQTRSLFGKQGADEEVVAHELAHQWFGDNLTVATWHDLWLKEGFASYLSWLWLEHSQGSAAFEQHIQDVYDVLVMSQYGVFFQPVGAVRPAGLFDLYGSTTYYRGALTLHALRLEVGDEKFFEILRTFYANYSGDGKTAKTDDFITLAQEVSGKDLTELFDLWLNTDWMPPKP